MKTHTYSIAKFYGRIFDKNPAHFASLGINKEAFLQFCLAAQLFHSRRYLGGIEYTEPLDAIRMIHGFYEDAAPDGTPILKGLLQEEDLETPIFKDSELAANMYACYAVVERNRERIKDGEQEYALTWPKFESIRKKIKVPGRFEYNKFILRDSIGSSNGLTVTIPVIDDQPRLESVETPRPAMDEVPSPEPSL